ncbi:MAG TPA: FadR/GntR family transcriptional regulator [Acidobacteriaceae bacterium]|nr:FadR/GntR family transcriptional regulator [Acidobacteriaceae bacterium]
MRKLSHRSYKSTSFLEGNGKEDVTSLLVKRFQEMLRDGLLRQGSRLPPERDLAAHFNVARSSLRQALKVLEVMGVITQKVGDGSYLNTDSSAILAVPMEFLFLLDDTSVGELTELRLLIEPGLARLAAERATAEDIALLRQSIHDFESSGGDNLKIVSSDLLFHRAIFQASKNGTATSVFHSIHRAMAKMILVTSQLVDLEHTLAFHKPIMQAIERRDGNRAARLMAEHLTDATAILTHEQEHQHQLLLQDRIVRERRPLLRGRKPAKKQPRNKAKAASQ